MKPEGRNMSDIQPHNGLSVPFPGARNYGGHLSLQKFDGQQRISSEWFENGNGDSETYSMDHMNKLSTYGSTEGNAKKFHTLEASQHKKLRNNGLLHSISFDDTKMKNGESTNGIKGVLLRPLDSDGQPMNGNGVGGGGGGGGGTMVVPLAAPGAIPHSAPIFNKNIPLAVEARNVVKSYGKGSSRVDVLKGLNLTVPQGAIYGLLGPSGCGKTTLLKTIVGRLSVKSGFIKVHGHYPGTPESGIPGPSVGYMPQDIALFNEFTIKETLEYFGRIYKMKSLDIQRRMFFLLEFLHLPKGNRFVKNLSGGQKRRVSFAVALLKEPPLLILDEPTVGVDPLLRQSIWMHLVTIAKGGNTTIMITTHYIEEARQAHVVGLMRNGHLLAEDAPETLLLVNNLPSLEEVFLKLCMYERGGAEEGGNFKQEAKAVVPALTGKGKQQSAPTAVVTTNGNAVAASNGSIYPFNSSMEVLVNDEMAPKKRWCNITWNVSAYKVYALVIKNMLKLWRNLGYLGFQFLLPSIQIILFCLAIGRAPKDLPMAVVNLEGFTNHSLNFGNMFLSHVPSEVITQHHYNTNESALAAVKNGDMWGVLLIPANFSQDLISRVYQGPAATDDVIDGSTLKVYLDSTNQQISYTIREKVLKAFQEFSFQQMNVTGSNPKLGQIPVLFEDPVYGPREPNFTEFMAPGIILSVSYFMAVGLTALTFVLERKEGLLDRTWVAGVNVLELMIGHFFTQFFVMVVQIALSLLFMIVAFNVPCQGPPIWVILLTLAQGMCGMAYGLLISSFCDEENSAIMFALGSFYPSLLLSGIIWPIESMPNYLRYVSYVVPQTFATEGLRALLSRGWDITYMVVWRGFATTLGWFLVFFILSAVIFRFRR